MRTGITAGMSVLMILAGSAFAGPFFPNTPAVTREFTVFVGDRRAEVHSRDVTYFGGVFQNDVWSRDATWFGGVKQVDAWSREQSVEAGPDVCLADLAPPEDILDLADINAFIDNFVGEGFRADLVAPPHIFDLADINAFVTSFVAGCP